MVRAQSNLDFFLYLGNDALHEMTENGGVELLILMENWEGVWKHARYSDFRIYDENLYYMLRVSGYSGTAGII